MVWRLSSDSSPNWNHIFCWAIRSIKCRATRNRHGKLAAFLFFSFLVFYWQHDQIFTDLHIFFITRFAASTANQANGKKFSFRYLRQRHALPLYLSISISFFLLRIQNKMTENRRQSQNIRELNWLNWAANHSIFFFDFLNVQVNLIWTCCSGKNVFYCQCLFQPLAHFSLLALFNGLDKRDGREW